MNKGGFSWKRFVGISRAKSNVSRMIGVPLTKSGRERKLGKMVSGGCLGIAVVFLCLFCFLVVLAFL